MFTGLVVALVISLGLLIALLLNRSFPGCGLVRTLLLVPWAIPPVVNGLMWQWIYDSKVGALNGLLVASVSYANIADGSRIRRRRFWRWYGPTSGTWCRLP